MQLRNVEKIKKSINIELENRINNHKKNYHLQLNLYNNESSKYENYIRGDKDLDEDNLTNLLNQILMILRINKIENSKTTIEKIWFMCKVDKIVSTEEKM